MMKTFQEYIDQYGMSGYKFGGGYYAPLVAMLRDEVASSGSTQLSALDRAGLTKLQASLPAGDSVEQFLANAELPFASLRFDGSNVPIINASTPSQIQPLMDAAFKQYGSVLFVHGEKDNPFIQHTDRIENNGTVRKDVFVGTDVNALKGYYDGAISATILGTNYLEKNNMVHTSAEMTNMLKLVIQYGVDTADNVQKYFGNYSYAPGVASAAIAAETKLPVVAQLSDPQATVLEKAYIAYYGRPADPAGLAFWVDAVKKTGSVTDMVNLFGNSDEYHHLYSQASSTTVVGSLYEHLFNREAETDGLNFWVKNLDAGKLTLANIAFELVNGAQGNDQNILNEKIAAATTFTALLDTQREVDLYSNDLSALNARKWLSTIGADHNANVAIVGIANDVINQLQGSADGVLSGHGLHPNFY
jgi:hypothetical protein